MNMGWIGLGAMGFPMARARLDQGRSVTAYDIRPSRVRDLADLGAGVDSIIYGGGRIGFVAQCRRVLMEQGVLNQNSDPVPCCVFSTIGPKAIGELE